LQAMGGGVFPPIWPILPCEFKLLKEKCQSCEKAI
jgi:hypothetical protein